MSQIYYTVNYFPPLSPPNHLMNPHPPPQDQPVPPPSPPPIVSMVRSFNQLPESSYKTDVKIGSENGQIVIGPVLWNWLLGTGKELTIPRTTHEVVGLAAWRLWEQARQEEKDPLCGYFEEIIKVGKEIAESAGSQKDLHDHYQNLLIRLVGHDIIASSPGLKVPGRLITFQFRMDLRAWVLYIESKEETQPFLQVTIPEDELFNGYYKLEDSSDGGSVIAQ